jgi:hypothetical protein
LERLAIEVEQGRLASGGKNGQFGRHPTTMAVFELLARLGDAPFAIAAIFFELGDSGAQGFESLFSLG